MKNLNEINNWIQDNKLNDNILNFIKGYLSAKDIEIDNGIINMNENDVDCINNFIIWLEEDGILDPKELVEGGVYFKQHEYYNYSYIMRFKSLSHDTSDKCHYYYMLNSEKKLHIDDYCDSSGWENANSKQINELTEAIRQKNTIY